MSDKHRQTAESVCRELMLRMNPDVLVVFQLFYLAP